MDYASMISNIQQGTIEAPDQNWHFKFNDRRMHYSTHNRGCFLPPLTILQEADVGILYRVREYIPLDEKNPEPGLKKFMVKLMLNEM
jgi:hypothetical protein